MHKLVLLLSVAVSPLVIATPILGPGAWSSFGANPNNDHAPFWDRPSADGVRCNVGFFLAGNFGPCNNRKNGTPAAGLQLGASDLEFYSLGGLLAPFQLAAGSYTFRLEGRIAGSNTFVIGYRTFGLDTPIFTQANQVGNTFQLTSTTDFSLYIRDGSHLFRSTNTLWPGVMAARQTSTGRLYFGFEDRPHGDRDYNDVVISAVATPEPATFALIGLALIFAGLFKRLGGANGN